MSMLVTPDERPEILIFDLGEVLVTPTDLMEALSSRVTVEADRFSDAYWTRRLEYDLGLRAEEYWADVLESLDMPVSESVVEDLIRIDTVVWTTIRPDAERLLRDVRRRGVRLAILSNATREMAAEARASDWGSLVGDWFFSVELGLAKPNPAIYAHVSGALAIAPHRIAYVEDSEASVSSAERAGWNAHLWTSPATAREYVASILERAGN